MASPKFEEILLLYFEIALILIFLVKPNILTLFRALSP